MTTSNNPRFVHQHLVKMLQTAVRIELTTIPLYLFAQFSIKDEGTGLTYSPKQLLRTIVVQEMLHLTLAGNILTSVASGPKLYTDPFYLPTYGGPDDTILKTRIKLQLRGATGESLESFVEIEKPYKRTGERYVLPKDVGVIPDFNSIGRFYEAIEQLIKEHYHSKADKQFSPAEFPATFSPLTQIRPEEPALAAITTIIEQGEGGPDDPTDNHYTEFKELVNEYNNAAGDAWTLWPVVENPKTSMYKAKPFIYQLSRAFDALYCYVLATIEQSWETVDTTARARLVSDMLLVMRQVFGPLAGVLVQQPWDDETNAAPAFNRYDVDADNVDDARRALLRAGKGELAGAIALAPPTNPPTIRMILIGIERILPSNY